MTRKKYRIGIGIVLTIVVIVSVLLLCQKYQREKVYEDGVLVRAEKSAEFEKNQEQSAIRERHCLQDGEGSAA